MNKFIKNFPKWIWLPLAICLAVNCFVYWITQFLMQDSYHYDFTTAFDDALPLRAEWVSIYVLSYFFWIVSYIIIAKDSKDSCGRLVTTDLMAKIFCGVIFIVIPTTNVRPELGTGFWDTALGLIYSADQPFNLFPSIHCLVSWICFAAMRDSKSISKGLKIFTLVFAILICISTQLTKQHYIVDLIAGIGIAELSLWLAGNLHLRGKVLYEYTKVIFHLR